MNLRTDDEAVESHLSRTVRELLPADTFEGNTGLSDLSLLDVVDRFWPAAHGWEIVTTRAFAKFHVGFEFRHSTRGIAMCLIGTQPPDGSPGSVEAWDSLDVAMRARNIWVSSHAHAATAMDMLDHFNTLHTAGSMNTSDEWAVAALLHSPALLDDAARMMLGLGQHAEMCERAMARVDRADLAVWHAPLTDVTGSSRASNT